jgi:hypothetical protein
MSVQSFFLEGSFSPVILTDVPEGAMIKPETNMQDGYIMCSSQRSIVTHVNGIHYDLSLYKYEFLIATGNVGK